MKATPSFLLGARGVPRRWVIAPRGLMPFAIGACAFVVDLYPPDNVADGCRCVPAVHACVPVPGARAAPFPAAALQFPIPVQQVLGVTTIWLAALVRTSPLVHAPRALP